MERQAHRPGLVLKKGLEILGRLPEHLLMRLPVPESMQLNFVFPNHQFEPRFFIVSAKLSIHSIMGSKQFSFVNISHPEEGRSRHNLTHIRRHVMADVGRSKRKKPRYKIIPLQVASGEDESQAKPVNIELAELAPLARMPPSFQTHLVDTNARACELISFSKCLVHTARLSLLLGITFLTHITVAAEADYVYRPFRTSWVQIGLSDATAFDLWLAQAIVIRDLAAQEDNTSCPGMEYLNNPEANKYYGRCLNQLSHRLSSREECVSIGVIATIMGFICIDVRNPSCDSFGSTRR